MVFCFCPAACLFATEQTIASPMPRIAGADFQQFGSESSGKWVSGRASLYRSGDKRLTSAESKPVSWF